MWSKGVPSGLVSGTSSGNLWTFLTQFIKFMATPTFPWVMTICPWRFRRVYVRTRGFLSKSSSMTGLTRVSLPKIFGVMRMSSDFVRRLPPYILAEKPPTMAYLMLELHAAWWKLQAARNRSWLLGWESWMYCVFFSEGIVLTRGAWFTYAGGCCPFWMVWGDWGTLSCCSWTPERACSSPRPFNAVCWIVDSFLFVTEMIAGLSLDVSSWTELITLLSWRITIFKLSLFILRLLEFPMGL